jgi:hypothetical protein
MEKQKAAKLHTEKLYSLYFITFSGFRVPVPIVPKQKAKLGARCLFARFIAEINEAILMEADTEFCIRSSYRG